MTFLFLITQSPITSGIAFICTKPCVQELEYTLAHQLSDTGVLQKVSH